jgi:hypothetical protein
MWLTQDNLFKHPLRNPPHGTDRGHWELLLVVQRDHQLALIRIERFRASPHPSACPSRGQARLGPFLDEMPLKLGQSRKDMERQFATGRGRLNGLLETVKADAVPLERGDPLDEVFDRAP